MKTTLHNRWLLAAVPLIAAAAVLLSLLKTVTLVEGGAARITRTLAATVGGALDSAGVELQPDDAVAPPLETALRDGMTITVTRAFRVEISVDGERFPLTTTHRVPGEILAEAGISLRPEDLILHEGDPAPAELPFPPFAGPVTLTVQRAVPVTLSVQGFSQTFYSSAPTLGAALREHQIAVGEADVLAPGPETPLAGPVSAELWRARELTLIADGTPRSITAAGPTVAEALAQAGVSVGALDFSEPPLGAPLPDDGQIRLVRVALVRSRVEAAAPFEKQTMLTPNLEIDASGLLQAGAAGVMVTEAVTRLEDGTPVGTVVTETMLVEPQAQIWGFGSQIVVRSVPGTDLQYWRAVTAYATSYSPCRLGIPNYCSNRTASGALVQKGVVAVLRSWYNVMAGLRVYVPGYGVGVIADIGGGVPGQHWIDLGYSDNDYVSWHQTVTVYFLTPVPPESQILWVLP